jgi:hypothetical protein
MRKLTAASRVVGLHPYIKNTRKSLAYATFLEVSRSCQFSLPLIIPNVACGLLVHHVEDAVQAAVAHEGLTNTGRPCIKGHTAIYMRTLFTRPT